jgi:hypothetical protein
LGIGELGEEFGEEGGVPAGTFDLTDRGTEYCGARSACQRRPIAV